jgi:hypothetical protein
MRIFLPPSLLPGYSLRNFAAQNMVMKKWGMILLVFIAIVFIQTDVAAQCSICTKTASQLGEKPAAALNTAIIYLMAAPFAIVGFIAWRWWKGEKNSSEEN